MASVTYSTSLWNDEKYDLYVWKREREWEDYSMYVASYSMPWDGVDDYDNDYSISAYTLNDLKDLILERKLKFSVDTEMWLRKRD